MTRSDPPPFTKIEISGPAIRQRTDSSVAAITLPLNAHPDREWREAFGRRRELAQYLAQLRFDNRNLVLFPGPRTGEADIFDTLDEVEKAIRNTNIERQEQASKLERTIEEPIADDRLDETLEEWSHKRTTN
jgi:hypothetical protein